MSEEVVVKKRGWGRPRGSKMTEEAKKKISKSVKARYKAWLEKNDLVKFKEKYKSDLEGDKL